jgi:hypothetical protein
MLCLGNLPDDIKNKILSYNINKNSDLFLNNIIEYKNRMRTIKRDYKLFIRNVLNINEETKALKLVEIYKLILELFFYENRKYIYKLLYRKRCFYIKEDNKKKIINYIKGMRNFNYLCGILNDKEFKIILLLFNQFLLKVINIYQVLIQN